ncbi:MAG: hypothetical protein KKA84_13040 [Bacteroidetes bacterium]|nr:hypothetical protein [Bacteroidota bacterium]
MIMIVLISVHGLSQQKCCHTEPVTEIPEVSCCSNHIIPEQVPTCDSQFGSALNSDCGCIHNDVKENIVFKISEIKNEIKLFSNTIILPTCNGQKIDFIRTLLTKLDNFVDDTPIYLQNYSFII